MSMVKGKVKLFPIVLLTNSSNISLSPTVHSSNIFRSDRISRLYIVSNV